MEVWGIFLGLLVATGQAEPIDATDLEALDAWVGISSFLEGDNCEEYSSWHFPSETSKHDPKDHSCFCSDHGPAPASASFLQQPFVDNEEMYRLLGDELDNDDSDEEDDEADTPVGEPEIPLPQPIVSSDIISPPPPVTPPNSLTLDEKAPCEHRRVRDSFGRFKWVGPSTDTDRKICLCKKKDDAKSKCRKLLDEPSNSTTLDAAVGEQGDEAVELQNRKLKCRKANKTHEEQWTDEAENRMHWVRRIWREGNKTWPAWPITPNSTQPPEPSGPYQEPCPSEAVPTETDVKSTLSVVLDEARHSPQDIRTAMEMLQQLKHTARILKVLKKESMAAGEEPLSVGPDDPTLFRHITSIEDKIRRYSPAKCHKPRDQLSAGVRVKPVKCAGNDAKCKLLLGLQCGENCKTDSLGRPVQVKSGRVPAINTVAVVAGEASSRDAWRTLDFVREMDRVRREEARLAATRVMEQNLQVSATSAATAAELANVTKVLSADTATADDMRRALTLLKTLRGAAKVQHKMSEEGTLDYAGDVELDVTLGMQVAQLQRLLDAQLKAAGLNRCSKSKKADGSRLSSVRQDAALTENAEGAAKMLAETEGTWHEQMWQAMGVINSTLASISQALTTANSTTTSPPHTAAIPQMQSVERGLAALRSMAEYEVRRSEENKKKEAKFWGMMRGGPMRNTTQQLQRISFNPPPPPSLPDPTPAPHQNIFIPLGSDSPPVSMMEPASATEPAPMQPWSTGNSMEPQCPPNCGTVIRETPAPLPPPFTVVRQPDSTDCSKVPGGWPIPPQLRVANAQHLGQSGAALVNLAAGGGEESEEEVVVETLLGGSRDILSLMQRLSKALDTVQGERVSMPHLKSLNDMNRRLHSLHRWSQSHAVVAASLTSFNVPADRLSKFLQGTDQDLLTLQLAAVDKPTAPGTLTQDQTPQQPPPPPPPLTFSDQINPAAIVEETLFPHLLQ